jgi:type IV pilus assembly protein PilO
MALGIPKDPAGQKRLLIGALPVLAAVAYWNFVYSGKTEEIATLQERYEAIETKNAGNRGKASPAAIRAQQQKLALYDQHMKRLEELIPLREEVPGLLRDMTARAGDAGVDLRLMEPEGEEPGQFYTQQSYKISVIGAYHAIGRFLAQTGSLPRIITPIELSVTAPGNVQLDRPGGARLQADFRIRTYIIPPDTLRPAAPRTAP